MGKTVIAKLLRFLLTIVVSLCACGAASAADTKNAQGQLEHAAGQNISDVSVPSVQTPSITPSTGTAGGYSVGGSSGTTGGYSVGESSGTAGGTSAPAPKAKPTTQGNPIIKPSK